MVVAQDDLFEVTVLEGLSTEVRALLCGTHRRRSGRGSGTHRSSTGSEAARRIVTVRGRSAEEVAAVRNQRFTSLACDVTRGIAGHFHLDVGQPFQADSINNRRDVASPGQAGKPDRLVSLNSPQRAPYPDCRSFVLVSVGDAEMFRQ